MTNDLTKGKPMKLLLLFTLPVLLGNVFQQLYSLVDTLIVGNTISWEALGAVSATGAISFLVVGFVSGIASGFAVITAQQFGAKDENGIRRSVAMSIELAAAVTVVVTLLAVFTARPLLKLMQTPDSLIEMSYQYILPIYIGTGATMLYNLFSCFIRALGDSKTPLIFLMIASVLNIGLDFLFIMVFHMGVAGAGWATVLSQLISGIACVCYSFRKFEVMHVSRKDFRFRWGLAWTHLRVGIPMAFQFSITAIGVMFVQGALNQLDTEGGILITAYGAGNKVDNLCAQMLISVGAAVATYVGQNYGAREYKRIREGVNCALILGAAFSVIGFFIAQFLGKPLLRLFFMNETDETVINGILANGQQYLTINAACYLLLSWVFIYRNALQGMGRSVVTMFAGGAELAMRAGAALIFARFWGYFGLCFSSPVAWLGADILLMIVYYLIIRRLTGRKKTESLERPV